MIQYIFPIIFLFIHADSLFAESKTTLKRKLKYETFVGKFVYANVLEGTASYGFKDNKGNTIYFRSKIAVDKNNISYSLLNDDGFGNEKFLNHTFKIAYLEKWESSDEDERKIKIFKIMKIQLLSKK